MSGSVDLDLRYPIGGLFIILGFILAAFGLMTGDQAAMYERSGAVNVNLWWGVVMLVFGALFLWLAARAERLERSTPGA